MPEGMHTCLFVNTCLLEVLLNQIANGADIHRHTISRHKYRGTAIPCLRVIILPLGGALSTWLSRPLRSGLDPQILEGMVFSSEMTERR
jgi:hypothetical protein